MALKVFLTVSPREDVDCPPAPFLFPRIKPSESLALVAVTELLRTSPIVDTNDRRTVLPRPNLTPSTWSLRVPRRHYGVIQMDGRQLGCRELLEQPRDVDGGKI
ncbi:hypothetical protein PM082_015235 [Marasmius tenuissimus]|nr:hypothetical protein PM082_015235 [Marasmius tenuissimus]